MAAFKSGMKRINGFYLDLSILKQKNF